MVKENLNKNSRCRIFVFKTENTRNTQQVKPHLQEEKQSQHFRLKILQQNRERGENKFVRLQGGCGIGGCLWKGQNRKSWELTKLSDQ